MREPIIVYAANRRLGLDCLRAMLDAGGKPAALLVAEGAAADCSDEMRRLVPDVPRLRGQAFRTEAGLAMLCDLAPDWIVGVHFPYIVPPAALAIARTGFLNLHPALLPYNRGWHTPSWAILDGTPYGATLHWMDEGLDTGDIAMQRPVEVRPDDTAHGLYQRELAAELELFREALPLLLRGVLPRTAQPEGGTLHRRSELAALRSPDPAARVRAGEFMRRIRALTTNAAAEAVIYPVEGCDHALQAEIVTSGPARQAPPDALPADAELPWRDLADLLVAPDGLAWTEAGHWVRAQGRLFRL
ncbi:MAG: formyltransferase family protein [Armatimonadetes bacterium]|nr:formyltransferase family protein [Armatimonadota bacterium]